jgi:hypothetical protein
MAVKITLVKVLNIGTRGCIFSRVRPFCECAVSKVDGLGRSHLVHRSVVHD